MERPYVDPVVCERGQSGDRHRAGEMYGCGCGIPRDRRDSTCHRLDRTVANRDDDEIDWRNRFADAKGDGVETSSNCDGLLGVPSDNGGDVVSLSLIHI